MKDRYALSALPVPDRYNALIPEVVEEEPPKRRGYFSTRLDTVRLRGVAQNVQAQHAILTQVEKVGQTRISVLKLQEEERRIASRSHFEWELMKKTHEAKMLEQEARIAKAKAEIAAAKRKARMGNKKSDSERSTIFGTFDDD